MENSTPLTQGSTLSELKLGGIEVLKTSHDKHFRIRPHSHERPALTFVIEGAFEETVNGCRHVCENSTLLYKPGGIEHTNVYGADGATSIIFSFDRLRQWLPEEFEFPKKAISNRSVMIRRLARQACQELNRIDSVTPLSLQSIFLAGLAELIRCDDSERVKRLAPEWLRAAIECLERRYRENLSLKTVADYCGVHPVHLASEMKRRTGITVGEYIRKLRLEKTCERLIESDDNITSIAHWIGFSDASHLCRVFKAAYGISPTEYRKQSRLN